MDLAADSEAYSLPLLQSRIKTSPGAYVDDFEIQWHALQLQIKLFEASPQSTNKKLEELLMFAAQTAGFYNYAEVLMQDLTRLLQEYFVLARMSLIKTFISALSVLDRQSTVDKKTLYEALLELLELENDAACKQILSNLLRGLQSMKCERVSKAFQIVILHKLPNVAARTRRFLQFLLISLYFKNVWRDRPVANALAELVFDADLHIVESSARFLLGDTKRLKLDDFVTQDTFQEDADDVVFKNAALVTRISNELSRGTQKKGKNARKLVMVRATAQRQLVSMSKIMQESESLPFIVLSQIYNPYSFCERITRLVQSRKLRYKLRLLLLTLAARLMRRHEIYFPGFLARLQRFISVNQKHVSRLLALIAESVHVNVPNEDLRELIRYIADQFLLPANSSDLITIGINTIREICLRNASVLDEAMVSDFLSFGKRERDNSVRIAVASLRHVVAEKRPELLSRKFATKISHSTQSYLAERLGTDLDGIEILIELKRSFFAKMFRKYSLTAEEVLTSSILSENDFEMLRIISLKQRVAKASGVTLKQWLEQDEEHWLELANEVLGEDANKRRNGLCETDESESTVTSTSYSNAAEASLEFNASAIVEKSLKNNVEPEANIDLDGDECNNSSEEHIDDSDENSNLEFLEDCESDSSISSEEDYFDNEHTADEMLSRTDGDVDRISKKQHLVERKRSGKDLHMKQTRSAVDIEDSSADETESMDYFVTPGLLESNSKMNKARQQELKREEKKNKRKSVRQGGKETNRAGISNRSQARNKPMAMLRQKVAVRSKGQRAVVDRISVLKAHVKTLKKNKRQKFRRR